jgi:hypothetical protein
MGYIWNDIRLAITGLFEAGGAQKGFEMLSVAIRDIMQTVLMRKRKRELGSGCV